MWPKAKTTNSKRMSLSMDETSSPYMRNEEFWQKVILAVTESERRKIAMAQLITELFFSIFNFPAKYPVDEKYAGSSINKKLHLKNAKRDKVESITEHDFIKRKWEMHAKSKL